MKKIVAAFSLSLIVSVAFAAISTYAIVSPSGTVLNLTSWDGVSTFNVSPNTPVATNGNANAQVGGTYSGGTFTAPAPGAPAPGIVFQAVVSAGGTTTLPGLAAPPGGGYRKLYNELQPAAATAGQTIVAPPSPQDGDDIYLLSVGFNITSVTFSSPGVSQINIPATFTLTAGVSAHITYSAQLNAYFRL